MTARARTDRVSAHPRRARALVVDVDNTLFDWTHAWAGAFEAMLGVLVAGSDLDRGRWCDAFKSLHEQRGTTECPDGLEHVVSAVAAAGHRVAASAPTAAALAYVDAWQDRLVPFDGAGDVLRRLASGGVAVVAFTESDASLTAARLARLGLAGHVRTVYGPRTARFPRDPRLSLAIPAPRGAALPGIRMLPRECGKPDPRGLRIILEHLAIGPGEAVCLGDHLVKDVRMAREAGVAVAWAEYGTRRVASEAALLDSVSHWRPADVREERALRPDHVTPSWRIRHISELLPIVGCGPAEV